MQRRKKCFQIIFKQKSQKTHSDVKEAVLGNMRKGLCVFFYANPVFVCVCVLIIRLQVKKKIAMYLFRGPDQRFNSSSSVCNWAVLHTTVQSVAEYC